MSLYCGTTHRYQVPGTVLCTLYSYGTVWVPGYRVPGTVERKRPAVHGATGEPWYRANLAGNAGASAHRTA